LRTYKGEAWYRQEVEIPEKFKGKRIFLWFGGVDEKAKVWLNGKEIGISHGGAFLPFELDATPAVLPGVRNVVTVRLINHKVDELGTGGITAPVMFYAPAAGENAKLENVRNLQPTFP
jgi:beta-galactosidase